ncbi:hypothetical protein EDD15DRAFT_2522156 [Pisolithus albus]|nr:hypothetical protein EDD15DRAFT_2522156 [Pisolithus albus]
MQTRNERDHEKETKTTTQLMGEAARRQKVAWGWLEAASKGFEGVRGSLEGLEGNSKGRQPTAEQEPAPEPVQVGARVTAKGIEGVRGTGFGAGGSSSIAGIEGETYLEARQASECDLGEGMCSAVGLGSTRRDEGGWNDFELEGGGGTWSTKPPGPRARAQKSNQASRLDLEPIYTSLLLDMMYRPCTSLECALHDHRRSKKKTFEAVLDASMPLEGQGMARSNLHTLEGVATHLTLLNTTRTRQGKALKSKSRLLKVKTNFPGVTRDARVTSNKSRGEKKASKGFQR